MGSLVTDATRWHWIFYINLPIGVIAIVALLIALPASLSLRTRQAERKRRIDVLGALLIVAATSCLLVGLTWGGNQIYPRESLQVIGALVASLLLFLCFFLVERCVPEPVVPLDLFRNQVFAAASLLAFLRGMGFLGLTTYLPLFFQGVLGNPAANAGALLTPLTVSLVIGSTLSTVVMSRRKRYQANTIVGTLVMALGTLGLVFMTSTTSVIMVTLLMIVIGMGTGTLFSVLNVAVQNAVPRTQLGVGTGAISYLGQLGAVLGSALVGVVVNQTLSDGHLQRLLITVIGRDLLTSALHNGFVAIFLCCVVAFFIALALKDLPMEQQVDARQDTMEPMLQKEVPLRDTMSTIELWRQNQSFLNGKKCAL